MRPWNWYGPWCRDLGLEQVHLTPLGFFKLNEISCRIETLRTSLRSWLRHLGGLSRSLFLLVLASEMYLMLFLGGLSYRNKQRVLGRMNLRRDSGATFRFLLQTGWDSWLRHLGGLRRSLFLLVLALDMYLLWVKVRFCKKFPFRCAGTKLFILNLSFHRLSWFIYSILFTTFRLIKSNPYSIFYFKNKKGNATW